MATVERRDGVLWFAHIRDGADLVARLDALRPGAAVALAVDGVPGRWVRMAAGAAGRPTRGLKAADPATRARWVGFSLGAHLGIAGHDDPTPDPAAAPPRAPPGRSATIAGPPDRPSAGLPGGDDAGADPSPVLSLFRSALDAAPPDDPTLCVGVDVTWWGGSAGDPASRYDCLTATVAGGDAAARFELVRVPLGAAWDPAAGPETANADPDAALLLATLRELIARHPAVRRVVVAVDAPLFARPRGLPPRRKVRAGGEAGTLARRDPERALGAAIGAAGAPWRRVCTIQPGAPVASRIRALVGGLTDWLGFVPYGGPAKPLEARVLVECFPAEALWALGVLGHADPYAPDEVRAYKAAGARAPRPWPAALGLVHAALWGFVPAAGVAPGVVNGWVADLTRQLLADPLVADPAGRLLRGGKPFDDAVDAAICGLTAVAFARGAAHAWLGPDPADGHIVGPGLPPA